MPTGIFEFMFQNFLKTYSQFSPIEDKETLTRLAIGYIEFWDINNGITLCSNCHMEKHAELKKEKTQ